MIDPVTRLSAGERVVIRHTLTEAEAAASGARLTDVVGTLTSITADHVVVRTKHGDRTVERARVVAAKEVPPPPSRRGRPHRAIGTEDLQRAMVDSWPPVEREALGDWLLRASSGFTTRGNSVLAVGDPGVALISAVDHVERWYADRHLPAQLALAGPVGGDPAAHDLARTLLGRGYQEHSAATVMTAASAEVATAASPTVPDDFARIVLERELTPAWLAAFTAYRPVVPGASETILRGSPVTVFASAVRDGEIMAFARLGVAHRWGGLSAVWVRPDARRLGLGATLSAALAEVALQEGAAALHLQVEETNAGATALYTRLGFTKHHAYTYLRQPT